MTQSKSTGRRAKAKSTTKPTTKQSSGRGKRIPLREIANETEVEEGLAGSNTNIIKQVVVELKKVPRRAASRATYNRVYKDFSSDEEDNDFESEEEQETPPAATQVSKKKKRKSTKGNDKDDVESDKHEGKKKHKKDSTSTNTTFSLSSSDTSFKETARDWRNQYVIDY